ncbi:MAG: HAMP domain-containing sensor histidine kinase, partial [Calditrichia bacterium]
LTLQTAMRFTDEADQKLNLSLAENMAAELSPALQDSLAMGDIEHMIHYMMVMNPKVEIYLLDEEGEILAFFADPRKKVKQKTVSLAPIHSFLSEKGEELILGADPRQPGRKRPFSAAPLQIGPDTNGFLYIILGGEQYDSAANMVKESYILQTTIKGLIITLFFTALLGLILFFLLTKRLHALMEVVGRFEKGHYDERVKVKHKDEIAQLGSAFNHMADTIVGNMEEMKRNDNLRRELVANVSHDLRSPLASMHGYLETILMKEENLSAEERRQYLEVILNNTTMLSQMVEELFELSKLDAQEVKPHPEPFPIAELVQDVVMKFKPRAEKSCVNLKANLPEERPLVNADIAMIERALSNLIQNALQFTPSNGSVSVDMQKKNGKVQISVRDTGCGIPEEEIGHIFDRFFRVEKSRGRTYGGTGLGLAITRKVLELHHSNIEVESKVQVGTRFHFDLDVYNHSRR